MTFGRYTVLLRPMSVLISVTTMVLGSVPGIAHELTAAAATGSNTVSPASIANQKLPKGASQPVVSGGSVYTSSGSAHAYIPGSGSPAPLSPGSNTAASSVGIANDPYPCGSCAYWVAHTDGTIDTFLYGTFYPGTPMSLNAPIAGIAPTPTGAGGWLVGTDGGVFAFGSGVGYYGRYQGDSNQMVAIVSTPSGNGYWEIASDGGVFSYGDAVWRGSLPGVGISVHDVVSATTFADGYCMVEANGYYACFYSGGWGRAEINPSGPFNIYVDPATAISADFGTGCAPYPAACGGWISDRQGHIYTYNGAVWVGGLSTPPYGPILGISGTGNNGYRLIGADGQVYYYTLPFEGQNVVSGHLGSQDGQAVGQVMLPEGNWGTWAEWNQGPAVWVSKYGTYVAAGLLPLYDWEDTGSIPPSGTWVWSAYNPNPCSGSNHAYGFPQACPGSKMSSTPGPALPDWQNNGWTQIAWGLWYVAPGNNGDGVTDPDSAYQYDIAHGGYAPTA